MRVEVVDIRKHYGSVKANDGVSLTLEPGEIHGILGENGAGKSTLMKVLSGFTTMTSGLIFFNSRQTACTNTAEAARLGIGMLYQDPLDFPNLSVLDNFMLGHTGRLRLHRKLIRPHFISHSESFHFHLQPDTTVNSLTVGERQQLELLRLLALGVEVLILDEPTTGISVEQKDVLYAALRRLAAAGKTVVLVSHKLEDVEALCDRVTVLRGGRVSGAMLRPFDTQALLAMMFGRPPAMPPRLVHFPGQEVMRMDRVSAQGGRAGLKECTAKIHENEVVGLAGLEGSGQEAFLRAAAGITSPARGSVYLCGRDMRGGDYHDFNHKGVVFVPAGRLEEALISGLSIAEHMALQADPPAFRLQRAAAVQAASAKIREFHIKGQPDTLVDELSGGNQQRLVLSFLPPNPHLLLLENPTRGLDVESVNWVWHYLRGYSQRGTGIVFASTELDEILTVADRILVFFDGQIIKDVAASKTDVHDLGRAIAGKLSS
jgi:general nucleoside transport system ATP-binding protein